MFVAPLRPLEVSLEIFFFNLLLLHIRHFETKEMTGLLFYHDHGRLMSNCLHLVSFQVGNGYPKRTTKWWLGCDRFYGRIHTELQVGETSFSAAPTASVPKWTVSLLLVMTAILLQR